MAKVVPAEIPQLIDVFPDWALNDAIFSKMLNVPWTDNLNTELLDVEYIGNRSGSKFCAPIVLRLLGEDESLSDSARQKLADIIVLKFGDSWIKLWATWATGIVDYTLGDNYKLVETRELETSDSGRDTTQESATHTGTTATQHGHTETTTHGLTETVTHGKTTTDTHSVQGFNSSTYNPAEQDINAESGTTGTAQGGTTGVTHGGTDTDTRNLADTGTKTKDTSASGTESETITRTGKIGDVAIQDIYEKERRLWLWNFWEKVFKDVDSVLALSVYDPCRV